MNKEFSVITYSFLGLFICLMLYMVYFQVVRSEDFINSPYNKRQDTFASRVVRGEIHSADGKVLAETKVDNEGNETRYYPYGSLYAHVVGFSTHGKSGIESSMNFNLLRSHGFILERMANELQGNKNTGDNVVTTLESGLQETAYNALGNYDGAVIVLEPATGKILAMVSKPDFDPNSIDDNWEYLTAEDTEETVLLNRVTQGMYPPGSTFKILTTLEYIRENPSYNEFAYACDGSIMGGNTIVHCFNNQVHGTLDLKSAFAKSCNSAYADIGMKLDSDKFLKSCNSLLFNSTLPGNLGAKESSFYLDADSGEALIMQTAIGQGETLVSPYHMALITSAIANDGVLMKPYLVDHTENENGTWVKAYHPEEWGTLLSEEEATVLQEYMKEVVNSGTGMKLAGASYTAAGKTGSAEFSDSNKGQSHSWFVGYAHQDGRTNIAVAIIAERAGTGSEVAVPIAKKIFDAYYSY